MRVADYIHGADKAIGVRSEIERINRAIGDAKRRATFNDYVEGVDAAKPKYVPHGVGTLAGVAAGAYLVKDHRVLGAIGGGSLACNVPALMNPALRKMATSNLITTGSAIAGATLIRGGNLAKVLGFVGGYIAGALVSKYTVGE